MFGATALRRKREREKREKALRGGVDQKVFPYIPPFGKKFDKNMTPYFKYRKTNQLKEDGLKVRSVVGI